MTATSAQAKAFTTKKNIVICSDGTGQRGGPGRMSNVWRTYLAVDPTPNGGPAQVRIHDDGVGSQSFVIFKLIGGAFGWGISRNLRALYTELILTWNPGDSIYLFGFSRGAYTVRVLAQMICLFGIPPRAGKTKTEMERIAHAVLSSYKKANKEASTSDDGSSKTAEAFRKENLRQWIESHEGAMSEESAMSSVAESLSDPHIHFIGCWDTVGAVGFPIESVTRAFEKFWPGWKLKFLSNRLNSSIPHARHALSIDDERRTFHPILWDEKGMSPDQTVKQVWFTGMHSNVGGSYPKDELAHVPLLWMLKEASDVGLKLHCPMIKDYQRAADAFGKMYDSRSGLAAYYRYRPRRIEDLCEPMGVKPMIHASTLHRIFAQTESYSPKAITNPHFEICESRKYKDNDLRPDPKPIERAFDYVWLNRGTYFLYLLLTLVLVGLGAWLWQTSDPLLADNIWIRTIASVAGCIELPILKAAMAIAPGFVEPLLAGYLHAPGVLSLILIIFVLLMFLNRRLFDLTDRAASEAWRGSRSNLLGDVVSTAHEQTSTLRSGWITRLCNQVKDLADLVLNAIAPIARRVRTHPWYRKFAWVWYEWFVPRLGVVGAFVVIYFAISRGLPSYLRWSWIEVHRHELLSSGIGETQVPAQTLADSVEVIFQIDVPYFDTKRRVEEGEHYRIKVEAMQLNPATNEYQLVENVDNPWRDNDAFWPQNEGIPANPVDGIIPTDKILSGILDWSHRHLERVEDRDEERTKRVNIFTMIAAIGSDADPETFVPIQGGKTDFVAAKSGRLYLFVNDVPGFYRGSNDGIARVTIKRVSPDG